MKKILLALLLAAISTGAMAEWIEHKDGWFYDSTSIRKDGDLVSMVWELRGTVDGKTSVLRSYHEFDCKTKGRSRLKIMALDGDPWPDYGGGFEWSIEPKSRLWPIACSNAVAGSASDYAKKSTGNPAANPADSKSAKAKRTLWVLFAVIAGGIVGILLFKLLGGSVQGSTPVATGRRWMNWLVFLSSIQFTIKGFVALFSGFGDPGKHFAMAVIIAPAFGLIGFVSGWLFAKFRGPKDDPFADQPEPRVHEKKSPAQYPSMQSPQPPARAAPVREQPPSPPSGNKFGPREYPDFRPAAAEPDTLQASVYAAIAKELESGETDKGLWTRLFAEANGDEKMTKVAYIKQRAAMLMEAERARSPAPGRNKSVVPEKPPTNGDDEWQLAKQSAELADQLHLSIAEARAMVTLGIEKNGDRFILKDGRGYSTLVEAISSARRGNG